jgi:ABC-type Fe3+/spermidine/putrescine transport system ATPase subunit
MLNLIVSSGTPIAQRPVPAENPMSKPGDPPLVELALVSKRFGGMVAVHPLSLEIRRGDFMAILGPSGCGKTTLLRMIAGFTEPSSGTIRMAGRDVTRLGPEKRPSNMVFQGYGLFPHMSVRQNVAYGLRVAKTPPNEIAERVAESLAMVDLEALANRSVTQLSGGQAQRVALARALVMKPVVLLLDEPLAALDLKLRKAMQEELRRIHASIGGTFVFVTHDQEEAMALANRIVVMESGRIVQVGTGEQIYDRPQTKFVSTFIGEANLFAGTCQGGMIDSEIGRLPSADAADGPVVIIVRPHAMHLQPAGSQGMSNLRPSQSHGDIVVRGRLVDAIFLGSSVKYNVVLQTGTPVTILTPDRSLRGDISPGGDVLVSWSSQDQRVVADQK